MTLFLEFFLLLALYYMYSVQSQMIHLLENQMNHLHELNLLLVGQEVDDYESDDDDDENDDDDCTEDCECEDENCCEEDCEENSECEDDNDVGENEKNENEETCATCNRDNEKCRCPNPYKLLSKKSQ